MANLSEVQKSEVARTITCDCPLIGVLARWPAKPEKLNFVGPKHWVRGRLLKVIPSVWTP